MAIAAANVNYSGNGPTATGQVLATRSDSGNFSRALIGTATFIGDGAATSATLNYIDGVNVLGFAPAAVIASRVGGNTTSTIALASVVDGANNGLSATVNFTVAPTNGGTITVGLYIAK